MSGSPFEPYIYLKRPSHGSRHMTLMTGRVGKVALTEQFRSSSLVWMEGCVEILEGD